MKQKNLQKYQMLSWPGKKRQQVLFIFHCCCSKLLLLFLFLDMGHHESVLVYPSKTWWKGYIKKMMIMPDQCKPASRVYLSGE